MAFRITSNSKTRNLDIFGFKTNRFGRGLASAAFILFTFTVYSVTGVIGKLASNYVFGSWAYWGCLLGAVATLGIYAVLWQYVLKNNPLNKAYLWKSSTVIISLLFAHTIFGEDITFSNILGAALILVGLVLSVTKS